MKMEKGYIICVRCGEINCVARIKKVYREAVRNSSYNIKKIRALNQLNCWCDWWQGKNTLSVLVGNFNNKKASVKVMFND